MFGALYAAEGSSPEILAEVAREFSPRLEVCGPREIVLDLNGLERLFGDARTIAPSCGGPPPIAICACAWRSPAHARRRGCSSTTARA